MWDEKDHAGRSWQLVFGILLIPVALFFGWLALTDDDFDSYGRGYGATSMALGAAYLSFRCFWYSTTGKDNINRDDF